LNKIVALFYYLLTISFSGEKVEAAQVMNENHHQLNFALLPANFAQ